MEEGGKSREMNKWMEGRRDMYGGREGEKQLFFFSKFKTIVFF